MKNKNALKTSSLLPSDFLDVVSQLIDIVTKYLCCLSQLNNE